MSVWVDVVTKVYEEMWESAARVRVFLSNERMMHVQDYCY